MKTMENRFEKRAQMMSFRPRHLKHNKDIDVKSKSVSVNGRLERAMATFRGYFFVGVRADRNNLNTTS